MGYSKAPEQPQSSARPIYHYHAMMSTGRKPATIRIATYRSSLRYALRHMRRAECMLMGIYPLAWPKQDTMLQVCFNKCLNSRRTCFILPCQTDAFLSICGSSRSVLLHNSWCSYCVLLGSWPRGHGQGMNAH